MTAREEPRRGHKEVPSNEELARIQDGVKREHRQANTEREQRQENERSIAIERETERGRTPPKGKGGK